MLVKGVSTQWLLVVAQYMCVWVLNVWTTFQPVLVKTFDNMLLSCYSASVFGSYPV